MTSAVEHCHTLLSAIIPDRPDLLEIALRRLGPEHFPDRTHATLFRILERYAEVTEGAVVKRESLIDSLEQNRIDAGSIALYTETYDLFAATDADEAAFRWSVDQVRELAAARATGVAITEAMEILTKGSADADGEEVRGHGAARTHLLSRFAEIDRELYMQEAPEGDMRAEQKEMMADYAARKRQHEQGHFTGIEFGIPVLDERINGLHPGELALLVGYTSEGKTSLAVQLAWNAVVNQGKNVVIMSTETVRDQVRRRMLARHSCQPLFGIDGGRGLNSAALKRGSLSEQDERAYARVVADFTGNPAHGRCWISQVPSSATMSWIESKAYQLQRVFPVDMVIMDYLALLRPERKRNTDREEHANNLKRSKQMSTTFNDGNGTVFASPWQVSRAARAEAEKLGFYTSAALSETAEASNSPDTIISLLAPIDNEERVAALTMQVMKHRDGERVNTLNVNVDYATSRFYPDHERTAQSPMDALILGLG